LNPVRIFSRMSSGCAVAANRPHSCLLDTVLFCHGERSGDRDGHERGFRFVLPLPVEQP
jgi:hypothetical protein